MRSQETASRARATVEAAKLLQGAVEGPDGSVVPLPFGLVEINRKVRPLLLAQRALVKRSRATETTPSQLHIKAATPLDALDTVEPKLSQFLKETHAFITAPIPRVGQENFVGEHTDDQPEGVNAQHFIEGYKGDPSKLHQLVVGEGDHVLQCFIPKRISSIATGVKPFPEAGEGIYKVVTPKAEYLIHPGRVGQITFSGLEQEVTLQDGEVKRDERTVIVEPKDKAAETLRGVLETYPAENRFNVGIAGLDATYVSFDSEHTAEEFSSVYGQALGHPTLAGTDKRTRHGVRADANVDEQKKNIDFDAKYSQLICGSIIMTPEGDIYSIVRSPKDDQLTTPDPIAITVMGHASFSTEDQQKGDSHPNVLEESFREADEEIAIEDRATGKVISLRNLQPVGVAVLFTAQEGLNPVSQRHHAAMFVYEIDPGKYNIQIANGENTEIKPQETSYLNQLKKPADWNGVAINTSQYLRRNS